MKALLLLQNELSILKVGVKHWEKLYETYSGDYYKGRVEAIEESIERLEEIIKKLEDENK